MINNISIRTLQAYLAFRKERSKMLLSRRNQLLLEFSFWNEPAPRTGPSIYELRSYRLHVKLIASVLCSHLHFIFLYVNCINLFVLVCFSSLVQWSNGEITGKFVCTLNTTILSPCCTSEVFLCVAGLERSNTDRRTMRRWVVSSHRLVNCMLFIICGVRASSSLYSYLLLVIAVLIFMFNMCDAFQLTTTCRPDRRPETRLGWKRAGKLMCTIQVKIHIQHYILHCVYGTHAACGWIQFWNQIFAF